MMTADRLPRVRVLVPLQLPDATPEIDALVARFTTSALRSLGHAGANISIVDVSSPVRPSMDEVCDADGILLLGGGDVDPAVYGYDGEPVDNLYGVDRAADDYSIEAVRAARERGVPVLGICRGSQVINVAAGGTLYPDLPDGTLHHGVSPDPMFLDEKVQLKPDTWISSIYGGRSDLTVRSGHHQAVRDVGEGLRVAAVADDGIVEGTQAVDGWCVGVQWHPEDTDGPQDDAAVIFGEFVRVCGEHAAR